MNKKFVLLLFIAFFGLKNQAQEILWNAGFNGFLDNREYFNPYAIPQTIFGARTFASVGLKVDNQNEFHTGVDFLYEFGSSADISNLQPILYYKYQTDNNQLWMGAFPRNQVYRLPSVLQNDTFAYYNPYLEGLYFNLNYKNAYQNVWIDWTSRQTTEVNEAFMAGFSGGLNQEKFFVRYDFMMSHVAGMAEGPSEIRDNGGLLVLAGISKPTSSFLDTITISTGFAGSYDRFRTYYDFRFGYGNYSEVYMRHNNFGLRSTLSLGTGLNLIAGDRMYLAEAYSRTDFIYTFINSPRVKGFLEFSIHIQPGGVRDYSQKFQVNIAMGGRKSIQPTISF